MNKRIKYLDELRVFAMILIIALHIIAIFNYKYIDISTFKFALTVFLSSFTRVGVPIFFMLTGVLLLPKKEEKYSVFFKKRVMRLIIAYVFFSCIYYIYQLIMGIKVFNLFELIREITSSQVEYHLWFMPVIITIYLLIPFIKKLVDNLKREDLKRLIIILFITVNCFYGINAITNVFGYGVLSSFLLPKLLGYINYLLIGYYIFNNDYKINKRLIITSIISILLIPLCTLFISRGSFQELFLDSISPLVVAPSILVFLLFKNKKKKTPNIISKFVSINTNNVFYVYLSHVLFLNVLFHQIETKVLTTTFKQDLGIMLLLWISVLVLSFLFSYIYVKVKDFIKNNRDKITKILIKCFYLVLILLFILIIINLLINKYHFINLNYLLFIIGLFVFMFVFYMINKYKDTIFKNKIINIVLILIYISFQILIAYLFMVYPSWDFGQIYDIAVNFATSNHPTFGSSYLYVCSNNIMFTVILELIFKLLYLIGIKNFLETGIIINIIMIDISIIYTYLLINKINTNYSKPYLIFILLFSPLIFYIPIFYTDTISMPFIIVPIYYLYLYFYKKQKISYLIISSIILGIGSMIKPTILILLVALLIYFVLINNKKNNYYIILPILIGLIVLPLILQKVFINHFFDQESLSNYKIPTVHYILIGLENNGEYSEKRYKEINSYVGEDIKVKETKIKIDKRINEMIKNKEILGFYNRKIAYTWTDGTFFSYVKLSRKPVHEKYLQFVYSENNKNSIYWLLSNVEWFIVLALMLIGIIKRKYLPKEIKELQLLIFISIFGLFLFLLIWETRSRYLVNYVPLFLVNAYIGLCAINSEKKLKDGRIKK